MSGSRTFCQMGSNFDGFYEGREDPNSNISGLTPIRERNAIQMAFRWRAEDGQILNAGLVALSFFSGSRTVLRNPIFYFSRGGGGVRTPCPPSGSAHAWHS